MTKNDEILKSHKSKKGVLGTKFIFLFFPTILKVSPKNKKLKNRQLPLFLKLNF